MQPEKITCKLVFSIKKCFSFQIWCNFGWSWGLNIFSARLHFGNSFFFLSSIIFGFCGQGNDQLNMWRYDLLCVASPPLNMKTIGCEKNTKKKNRAQWEVKLLTLSTITAFWYCQCCFCFVLQRESLITSLTIPICFRFRFGQVFS